MNRKIGKVCCITFGLQLLAPKLEVFSLRLLLALLPLSVPKGSSRPALALA